MQHSYLWENEQPTIGQSLFQYGLSLTNNLSIRLAAQADRLLGHIALDIAHPRVALSAYEKALALREKFKDPVSLEIAEVLDSIACSLTEIGDWGESTRTTPQSRVHFSRLPKSQIGSHRIHLLHDLPESKPTRQRAR